MTTTIILALALVLDALFGEPRWLWSRVPHPAVLMGRWVGWLDDTLNNGSNRWAKGILTYALLAGSALALGCAISALPFAWVFELLCAAILLAHRSLCDHVTAVANALRLSTGDGRLTVAMIVGRDTKSMDGQAVSRGAIESAAENFSDGVIAPALFFLVGGLPGLLLYKVTNTADSMIGYLTPKHGDFGWASAKADDLLNWIPARITAVLIALGHGLKEWKSIRADAKLHRSPNAGWPEAAMARALNVSLAGPRSYEGVSQDFPFVHPVGQKDIGPHEIDRAVATLWRSWGLFLAAVVFITLL